MAGPKVLIKLSQIEKVAMMQCTYAEAASFFNISTTAFKRVLQKDPRAQKSWNRGQENGKLALRRKQFRLASTNSAMAIFLGKQYLEQDDKTISEINANISNIDVSRLTLEEKKTLRELIIRTTRQ